MIPLYPTDPDMFTEELKETSQDPIQNLELLLSRIYVMIPDHEGPFPVIGGFFDENSNLLLIPSNTSVSVTWHEDGDL